MDSKISNLKEEDGILTFTLYNTDVSYANAIRRTILSDIPIVIFKTSPYGENTSTITVNTSRLNNEIIKQRLSCIPICITDPSINLSNYLLVLDVENNTDTMFIVTTKDFKIKDLSTDKFLDEGAVKKIFPPFIPPTGHGEYYIDFLKLRPKFSEEIPGEQIKLTCKFSVGTARDDSMFNVTGTCSYGCTPNPEKMTEQLEIRKQKWKDDGKNEADIRFESANWKLLEGLRYVKAKSFDFIIQSVGIYENTDIVIKSCELLITKLQHFTELLEQDEIKINQSDNTLENCYDVILENEDYTLGNILNYELYTVFYVDLKILNYVGFKKLHPHDNYSIVRIAFTDNSKGISSVKTLVKTSLESAIKKMVNIKGCFDGTR